jgi:hypothetical protein
MVNLPLVGSILTIVYLGLGVEEEEEVPVSQDTNNRPDASATASTVVKIAFLFIRKLLGVIRRLKTAMRFGRAIT